MSIPDELTARELASTPGGSGVEDRSPDPFGKGARIGRAGAVTIALLFGATALWLGLAPLNSAVVMPAQVKVENYVVGVDSSCLQSTSY